MSVEIGESEGVVTMVEWVEWVDLPTRVLIPARSRRTRDERVLGVTGGLARPRWCRNLNKPPDACPQPHTTLLPSRRRSTITTWPGH
jgi:hypothetical protein